MSELENELKKHGVDIAAFEYVRRLREISRMIVPSAGASTPVPAVPGGGGELFKGFSALGNRVRPLSFKSEYAMLLKSILRLFPIWDFYGSQTDSRKAVWRT